jgi:hypothetical protein
MGVFFLVIAVFFVIIAYVAVRVIVEIAAAVKRKNYKQAIISAIVLLLFFVFLYFAYVKIYDYWTKVLNE